MTTTNDAKGMRPDHWFRTQRYGYGATPITWEGWAMCALFGAAAMLVFAGFERPVDVLFALSLAAVFERLARGRTNGEWRWRWGGR